MDSRLRRDDVDAGQSCLIPTPNGEAGGIWESGCGPGVDTNGDLIAITGNGTFDTNTPRINYGDSFLRLTPGGGTMSVTSFFTPLNEFLLDDDDLDMGSGGNLLLPDQPGPNPHLMVGVGKVGTLYLVNRDSMGGFNASRIRWCRNCPARSVECSARPRIGRGRVPDVGLQNMIYTIGVTDEPKMFCDLQWTDPDTARFGLGEIFYLGSRARRRLSPPTAPPAASCGRSTVRPGSRVVRCGSPCLRRDQPESDCTTATSSARTIPGRR